MGSFVICFLPNWIENRAYRDIIGFILIFISVYLIIMMLARLVQYLMKISLTGWLDRLLGMALGLLKGVIVCALLLIGLKMLFSSKTAFVENSILVPYYVLQESPAGDSCRTTIFNVTKPTAMTAGGHNKG